MKRVKVFFWLLIVAIQGVYAQTPSSLDLDLQKEGILDKNFRYTKSPKVFQFYRETTAFLNQSAPVDMGDGVKMIQALQMPSMATYIYQLPIISRRFTSKEAAQVKAQYLPSLKSIFCHQVNKHIHYRINDRQEKFIYIDQKGTMLMDIDLKAKDCTTN